MILVFSYFQVILEEESLAIYQKKGNVPMKSWIHNMFITVAILTTVVGKIEYGLLYRRSTKLGSGYLLTVLIMDSMFTNLYVTVVHALSEQYSRTDIYSLKQ